MELISVALTIPGLDAKAGGPTDSVIKLSNHLAAIGVRIRVISVAKEESRHSQRVSAVDTSLFRASWTGLQRQQLGRIFQQKAITIVHDSGMWLPFNHSAVQTAIASKLPVVIHIRGMLAAWPVPHKTFKEGLAWWLCRRRELLRADWRGEVFAAGSVEALAEVLRRWIAKGKKTPETTAKIKAWSRCIEGKSAAGYLEAILDHLYQVGKRPTTPWRS